MDGAASGRSRQISNRAARLGGVGAGARALIIAAADRKQGLMQLWDSSRGGEHRTR